MEGPKVSPIKKWIEFGGVPEDGMDLFGFSTPAILEGRDLKEKIVNLLREEKDVGFRKAVLLFRKEGGATAEQALKVIREIREDWEHSRRSTSVVMKKEYPYSIDKVFWAFSKDVPKDPRYFKLKVVDVRQYQDPQNVPEDFDPKEFIRKNMTPEDLAKYREALKSMSSTEIVPESKETQIQEEWEKGAPQPVARPQKTLRIKRPKNG